MTAEHANLPVTRSEFHLEFMIVWLFIVVVSAGVLDADARWSSLLVPVFALVMVFLHGRSYRRAVAAPRASA